jgi:hypothetical protein
MKKVLVLAVLILTMLALGGCSGEPTGDQVYVSFFNDTPAVEGETTEPDLIIIGEEEVEEIVEVIPEEISEEVIEEPVIEEVIEEPIIEEVKEAIDGNIPVKTYVEGDLVTLSVQVSDADDDQLIISYSYPLDAEGKWETKEGDAGQYKVEISVSDGKESSSQEVLLMIEPRNKPPVIQIDDELTFKEGTKVILNPTITDPDKDEVTVKYSGWITESQYQLGYEETGTYLVTIIADDGVNSVAKDVKIHVENVNREPVITFQSVVKVKETDSVSLSPIVTDADKDDITLSFDGIVDETGKWETEIGDEGSYEVTITADDGNDKTSKTVEIIVEALNRPPVIQRLPDIDVKEGETVFIRPTIIDPDGDEFTVSYSGWMTSNKYTTSFDDEGTYNVIVTATDSKGSETTQDVKVNVENVNRAPEIVGIE